MVLRYLDKCLHSPQQLDRKIYGAGLHIYLIANAATQLVSAKAKEQSARTGAARKTEAKQVG
jgi:hypothetical protein